MVHSPSSVYVRPLSLYLLNHIMYVNWVFTEVTYSTTDVVNICKGNFSYLQINLMREFMLYGCSIRGIVPYVPIGLLGHVKYFL